MKQKKITSIILLLILAALTACSAATQAPTQLPSPQPTVTAQPTAIPTATTKPKPMGVYIDEDLPGVTPERFGEAFFRGSFHSSPVFAPDGKTVWWGGEYGSATIYTSQFQSDGWTDPATIAFSDSFRSYRDPFISPDGRRMFYISTASIPGAVASAKENIWMMEKEEDGWSEPQPLPDSINALDLHWTMSVNDNYDLYFSAGPQGNKDIFVSRFIYGEYTEPVALEATVNSGEMEITPNIAPDGSYLLFTRYFSADEDPFLYISYATDSGWSEAVKVENIPYCISPIITPDRSYLIFMSSPSSFSWRDTTFIEELRP
jgi:hypothetical protein